MIWSSTSLQTQVRVTIMPYSSQQLLQMQACWNIKNFSGGCVFFGMMKCMDVYPQYRYFMSLHKTSETVLHAMCSQQFWHLYVSNFLFLYFIATSCLIFLSPEIQQLDRTIGYVLDVSGNLDTSLGLFINPHSPKVVRSTAKSTKIQRMATAVDIKYESALGVWSQNNHSGSLSLSVDESLGQRWRNCSLCKGEKQVYKVTAASVCAAGECSSACKELSSITFCGRLPHTGKARCQLELAVLPRRGENKSSFFSALVTCYSFLYQAYAADSNETSRYS